MVFFPHLFPFQKCILKRKEYVSRFFVALEEKYILEIVQTYSTYSDLLRSVFVVIFGRFLIVRLFLGKHWFWKYSFCVWRGEKSIRRLKTKTIEFATVPTTHVAQANRSFHTYHRACTVQIQFFCLSCPLFFFRLKVQIILLCCCMKSL